MGDRKQKRQNHRAPRSSKATRLRTALLVLAVVLSGAAVWWWFVISRLVPVSALTSMPKAMA